ncbi:Uncharacterised protein [Streptococcus pneumoniae]|nr:Uncharacterised protein [Streptococcus pneumoniae]
MPSAQHVDAVLYEGAGLVDRRHHGAGQRVGLLAGVHGGGGEAADGGTGDGAGGVVDGGHLSAPPG